MIVLHVKRITNRGFHQEYPALQNINNGRIYVDTTLGDPRFQAADAEGLNRCGEYVGHNLPGAWHSFCGEPECPLKRDVQFVLVESTH